MDQEHWTAVDDYLEHLLLPPDPQLAAAREANRAAELPSIDVSPTQGKFLHMLARLQGARRILEIGTLGGYSTIWLARSLPPGGRLVTLEANPKHAAVARANIAHAGLASLVDLRVAAALDTLPKLAAENTGPFDFIFIDADKPNNPEYLRWALQLSRVGSVIILDNAMRKGQIIEADSTDPDVLGTRRFFDMASAEPRLTATALQTVGSKGYDGFVLAIVNRE